jgi:hypothetical protein
MKDEEKGVATKRTENTEENPFFVNEDQQLLKRLNGAIEKNERLKEWILKAFPIMSRAFSIVIQEHRLDEIPGCRGILESCPIVDNAQLLPEIQDGWEQSGNHLRGWIPVKERLPEWVETVLVFYPVYNGRARIRLAWLEQIDKNGQGWDLMDGEDLRYGVTHWRPLPNPPTVEGGEGK